MIENSIYGDWSNLTGYLRRKHPNVVILMRTRG